MINLKKFYKLITIEAAYFQWQEMRLRNITFDKYCRWLVINGWMIL